MNLEQQSVIAWMMKNQIKVENGTPYSFDNHMFMYDILRDMSPKMVCLKAAQIGFSTAMLLKSLWVAKNKGFDIIYTLPTLADVHDFAGGKVNRIIAQNPTLKEWVKDHDTKQQKAVGDSIIYYRGTSLEKGAMMVSSDLNIYDEVDASKQNIIEQYSTRLQASEYGWEWFFSHPSLEDVGVDKYWKLSDQKHWFITCNDCKKEQYMSFPESFDQENEEYICKYCGSTLSNEERRRGRWRVKYKDREFSGYWIPLFIAPWVPASRILEDYRTKSQAQFYNKVLGLPYVGSRNKVNEQAILQNVTGELPDYNERVCIGVDTGLTTHLVAGNSKGLFYHDSSPGYAQFEELMRRFPKAVAVFDAHGDLQKPRELAQKYKGRIFLCYYRPDRKSQELVTWKEGENTVNADRNAIIQQLIDEFTGKRIPLLGSQDDWYDYWLHWNNIYATEKEDKTTQIMKRVWERNGDDHLVHATVYWRVAMTRFGKGVGHVGRPQSDSVVPKALDFDKGVRFKDLMKSHGTKKDWRNV